MGEQTERQTERRESETHRERERAKERQRERERAWRGLRVALLWSCSTYTDQLKCLRRCLCLCAFTDLLVVGLPAGGWRDLLLRLSLLLLFGTAGVAMAP